MLPTKIYDIQAHSSMVTCLNLGETGRVLVTGGQDCHIKLWAFGSTQCSMVSSCGKPGQNSSLDFVKFAYSDNFVYSAEDSGVIKLWDLNVGQAISLYGHMKSVRTLDVSPMIENCAVSGSNDTSIRLWDVRNQVSVKRYRGHMSHVNSVKISPDSRWIASAGNEGSVIIWDIRMSKLLMEFKERQTPATFVQFHPSEFLMAAGRQDGTVDLYDLEHFKLLTRTTPPPPPTPASNGQPVRCVRFDENGKCLFVGTAAGITLIGWEPDQEFDRIELNADGPISPWQLGDMHIAGQQLICGTYEGGAVAIHAVPFTGLRAFYAQPTTNHTFTLNQSARKSFNRGNGKLRLSIGVDRMGTVSGSGAGGNSAVSAAAILAGYDEGSGSNSADGGGGMSPNLSIEEIIDEEDVNALTTESSANEQRSLLSTTFVFDTTNGGLLKPEKKDFPVKSAQPPDYAPKVAGGGSSIQSAGAIANNGNSGSGTSRVAISGRPDYAPKVAGGGPGVQSGGTSTNNGNSASGTSRVATSGRGRQDGAGQSSATSSNGGVRSSVTEQRRLAMSSRTTSNLGHRDSTFSLSKSTLELYKVGAGDEPVTSRKPISRGSSPIRSNHHPQSQSGSYYQHGVSSKMHRSDSAQVNSGRQYGSERHQRSNGGAALHNSNIKVEIVTKPVVRSKTSLDMRHGHGRSAVTSNSGNFHGAPRQPGSVMHSSSASSMPTNGGGLLIRGLSENLPLPENGNGFGDGIGLGIGSTSATSEFEIQMLRHEHHTIMQTLRNRTALLAAIRRYTKEGNVIGALKVAVQMPDNQLLVDLLGAMLEKTSQWTLDMCVLLLPKLYDMLQSEHKFHCSRACDTLRDILATFLPVIRENTDPLGACTIGVDVSREERQKKCIECRRWLLKIRSLPENLVGVSGFQQLQNMLADI